MTITADNVSKKVPLILMAAVSVLALSSCVSEVQDAAADLKPTAVAAADSATVAAQSDGTAPQAQAGYVDPAMVSAASAHRASQTPPQTFQSNAQPSQPGYGQAAQIAGLAIQPTGIAAGSQSIFSNGASAVAAPAGAQMDNVPAYAPTGKIAPALNSVYSAPARPVMPPQAATPSQSQEHSANTQMPAAQNVAAGTPVQKASAGIDPQSVPIAAFFAGAAEKRVGSQNPLGTQVAALPKSAQAGIALAGRATMTDEFDDSHIDDDDKPAGLMKLASLSGLSRVAPNGLVLQTEQVNVGCFKPELIRRIKEVESHYQRPAIITSGYRPPKGTTQHSKHYTCEAADIQVKGVSKWELAEYLRSLPDRGGVGTYCHTESVHLDLGEPRDWNWRCRRTAQNL